MINYNWKIASLDGNIEENEYLDVVTRVHWRLEGIDQDGITAAVYNVLTLPEPASGSFVEFDNLTEEIVVGWLESNLDVQSKKDIIDNKIDAIKNPTTFSKPLPTQ